MAEPPINTVHTVLSELLEHQRRLHGGHLEEQSLVYAQALLRQLRERHTCPLLPPQVVVIGPTQSGKSTVVNLLLGCEAAGVSELAGFTRTVQGFATGPLSAGLAACTDRLLGEPADYSLLEAPEHHGFRAEKPWVVWDTPDFDSTASHSYRSLVPMLCAMADLIVLVASKEKYGDLSVWEMLRLIHSVRRPLLVCLNKVTEGDEERLLPVLKEKFAGEGIAPESIHALPYLTGSPHRSLLQHPATAGLLAAAREITGRPAMPLQTAAIGHFLKKHWQDWSRDLRAEHEAEKTWQRMVATALTETLRAYGRDYLQNPHYHEVLQQTVARLLELMEVPALAVAMTRVRSLLTWPARKLVAALKPPAARPGGGSGGEERILVSQAEEFAHGLARQAGQMAQSGGGPTWWRLLLTRLEQETPAMIDRTGAAIGSYQQEFEEEIERAARRLHDHLQHHPTTLNSLRAARLTADAAAVVLALKTGGIGPSDFFLAPALLSFTSMLAETSLGRFMGLEEQRLKERQKEAVRRRVFGPLADQLLGLPERMDRNVLHNISSSRFREASEEVERLAESG